MKDVERKLDSLNKQLSSEELAKVAFPVFVRGQGSFRGTPVKTGNARRNTKLQRNEILAQYAYAGKLDQGASKQAPDGMTEPTINYLQKYIDKLPK